MRIVPVCMLVCVCLLGIFQLTEAVCGTPKPVCADDSECTGKTSCLRKSSDEPKKCFPCPCKDNGYCIMVNNKVTCMCNPGFTGDNCECPFFQDCSPDDTTQYRGTQNQVPSGRTCQRWDSQSPHSHGSGASSMFPMDDSVNAAQNYCRDPGGIGYLWCFTMDPDKVWEKCNIPTC